jgi:hypothetical protein
MTLLVFLNFHEALSLVRKIRDASRIVYPARRLETTSLTQNLKIRPDGVVHTQPCTVKKAYFLSLVPFTTVLCRRKKISDDTAKFGVPHGSYAVTSSHSLVFGCAPLFFGKLPNRNNRRQICLGDRHSKVLFCTVSTKDTENAEKNKIFQKFKFYTPTRRVGVHRCWHTCIRNFYSHTI